jgi:hypothetical protein
MIYFKTAVEIQKKEKEKKCYFLPNPSSDE